jgi:autotransporter-associated beta strand protein
MIFINHANAQAFLDFSGGLSGWTTFGDSSSASVRSTTVNLSPGGVAFSLTPPAGQNMIQLQPNGSSVNIGNIDSTLGLTSGTMLGQVSTGSGPAGSQLTTTNYGGIKTTTTFAAGTYSFAWAYSAGDYLPYTDGVFFSIAGAGTSSVSLLARNGAVAITPGSVGYPSGVTILQSYGSTAWATQTFSISTPGNYTIGFGGFNALDTGLNPLLFIASVPGTYTGTPVATSGGAAPALGDIVASNSLSDVNTVVNPVFAGGTLTLTNGQSSNQNFTITSTGTISVGNGNEATVSGNITNTSGQTGSLTKTGAGSLTLTGSNTYSGGTTVSAGTLIGNTSSLQGAITNNATVTFNQASAGTYAGAMSGSGRLIISGSGAVTLSGLNTFSGGTEIQSGANLTISSSNALGAGSIDLIGTPTVSATLSTTATMTIANSITVAYDPTFNVASGTTTTVSSVIADGGAAGDVVVTGGGTLELTNINTYTGLTTIDPGSVLKLTGNGSITNSTTVTNNGTFSIADKTGNVNLGGTFTQGATGTLAMNFATTNNQQLVVNGAASLAGALSLTATAGSYAPGRYTLLTSSGLTGSFGSLSSNLRSFTPLAFTLDYDGTTVYLLLSLPSADTQQSLINTASVLQGTFTLQNTVMVNGFTYDCSLFDKRGICVSAGGRNTSVQAQGINNTSGLIIASYRLDANNSRIGAWIDQNLSMRGPGTVQLGNSTPMIGLFGVWSQRPDGVGAEVKVSAAYGQKDATVTRSIVGASEPGSGGSQLISQGAQVVAKYGFAVMPDVVVSPYAGVRYTQNNMGGYTEATSSTVTAPLTYSALNTNATTALVGAEARYRGIPKTTLFASAGVETDTNTSNGSYSATGASGLTPVNFNPNPVKTRATATVGGYYDILKNQRIGVTGIYRQEPFQAVSTTTVMATYTIGF